jgi:hypothetical protein
MQAVHLGEFVQTDQADAELDHDHVQRKRAQHRDGYGDFGRKHGPQADRHVQAHQRLHRRERQRVQRQQALRVAGQPQPVAFEQHL